MTHRYKTKGTCSSYIDIEMDGNVLKEVAFHGGCNGNLQGICKLVQGKTYEELKATLEGSHCGPRPTSCPDQLIHAMQFAMTEPSNM